MNMNFMNWIYAWGVFPSIFGKPTSFQRHFGAMPRLQVHPIASAALDVDLDTGASVAALKQALSERTGIAVEEQRLVLRGKLLEETADSWGSEGSEVN